MQAVVGRSFANPVARRDVERPPLPNPAVQRAAAELQESPRSDVEHTQ